MHPKLLTSRNTQFQVGLKNKSHTLQSYEGEKALLIKNYDGDWRIVKGVWQGFKKGRPERRDCK